MFRTGDLCIIDNIENALNLEIKINFMIYKERKYQMTIKITVSHISIGSYLVVNSARLFNSMLYQESMNQIYIYIYISQQLFD